MLLLSQSSNPSEDWGHGDMIFCLMYFVVGEDNLYYPDARPVSSLLPANSSLSRSVPGIPAATQQQPEPEHKPWSMR